MDSQYTFYNNTIDLCPIMHASLAFSGTYKFELLCTHLLLGAYVHMYVHTYCIYLLINTPPFAMTLLGQ